MKVVVFGAKGMLGRYITIYMKEQGLEVIEVTRKEFDSSDSKFDGVEQFLLSLNLDQNSIVINCVGLIPHASKQYQLTDNMFIDINTRFPLNLANVCEKHKIHMIHPTTDCVYSGKRGNYNEKSHHDEKGIYGISKSLGEPRNATVIRTSIIGEEIHNKRSLVEWVKSNKGQTVKGFVNHWWNGITCLQFAKIVYQIINENIWWTGVRHVYSPRTVTKKELVTIINTIYKLGMNIIPHSTENSVDKSITSLKEPLFEIPDIYHQIQEMEKFELS